MISDESKKGIDALSINELRYEIARGNRSRFQREKFAYLQTRLAELEGTEVQSGPSMKERRASLRERFEDHPLVFCTSLLVVGFLAGFAFSEWTMNFRGAGPNVDSSGIASQIEILTAEHNRRLAELHVELRQSEQDAVNNAYLDSRQEKHIQAAERIRNSISEENSSYRTHLEQLMRIADAGDA